MDAHPIIENRKRTQTNNVPSAGKPVIYGDHSPLILSKQPLSPLQQKGDGYNSSNRQNQIAPEAIINRTSHSKLTRMYENSGESRQQKTGIYSISTNANKLTKASQAESYPQSSQEGHYSKTPKTGGSSHTMKEKQAAMSNHLSQTLQRLPQQQSGKEPIRRNSNMSRSNQPQPRKTTIMQIEKYDMKMQTKFGVEPQTENRVQSQLRRNNPVGYLEGKLSQQNSRTLKQSGVDLYSETRQNHEQTQSMLSKNLSQARNGKMQSQVYSHTKDRENQDKLSQSGSLCILKKEIADPTRKSRQSSFSSQTKPRMKTSNLPDSNSELKKKNNREIQHMKFIQNYSESFTNPSGHHHNKQDAPNLMGYNKTLMQNESSGLKNAKLVEEQQHDVGARNRSKNFFKLDKQMGQSGTYQGSSQMQTYQQNGAQTNLTRDQYEFQISKQRNMHYNKSNGNRTQVIDWTGQKQYSNMRIGENQLNYQQFNQYLSNFVNSERYQKLQHRFENMSQNKHKNMNLSKLLLTPWSEKTIEHERLKCFNQIAQISQMSQNGLNFNNIMKISTGPNMTQEQIQAQKQYINHQNQLRSVLQKILTGNGNDQFLQRMGVGQDKCLSEQQVINLLNNYFSDVPPENHGISQSTSPSKYHIDESMLTKEQRRYLKKQKKQVGGGNEGDSEYHDPNKNINVQSMSSHLDCLNENGGTPSTMFGQPSTNQSPMNHNHASLGIGTNRKILSNRQKFMNKFSNNIHIIPDPDVKKTPYDGLFNLNGKQIAQNSELDKETSKMIQIEQHEYKANTRLKDAQRKKDNTIDYSLKSNIFAGIARATEKTPENEAKKMQMQAGGTQDHRPKQDGQKSISRQQMVKDQKRQGQNPAKQEPSPVDFDIEYAQLIARQFPIYDTRGKLIDYSNINEYQLELLALHEEYGEEKDPKKKIQIFHQLKNLNEAEFYAKRKALKLQSRVHHAPATNDGEQKPGYLQKSKGVFSKRPYGYNVGKDGGNPEYRKTVIQIEKERIERERQELMMKRKRNSNYIQQCIRHGNEHYDQQKLNGLNWLKKPKQQNQDDDSDTAASTNKIDDKNLQLLKKKQEIIQKYNQMSKQNNPTLSDDGKYRFNLIKGNNSGLVKRVLTKRDYWVELEQQHLTLYQFKWSPVSRLINYQQLGAHGQKKLVNHLERHDILTTKDQLFVNMYKFCEHTKVNVFQYLPIQFVLDLSAKNFISEVDKFCQYFNSIERVRKTEQVMENQGEITEINKFISQNKFIQADSKYKGMVSRKYDIDDQMYNGSNVWLIKPNDFNRGRGVKLFNTLEQLRRLMKEFSVGNEMDFYVHNACCQILANEKQLSQINKKEDIMPASDHQNDEKSEKPVAIGEATNGRAETFLSANVKSEVFVIQKYIERPLLIDERKFDIRLWIMVDACDLKDQKCYLFKEGYIRMSSHKFTLCDESIEKPFIHLTNNAVQQYDKNYGKLEEGNQLSFKQASEMIEKQTGRSVDFYEILNGGILEIIKMTFQCVDTGRLNPNAKKHSFEIFGYDFMIDEQLRPWLIEVNTNPCLEETSALLRSLLPRMIDDAFKLTLDVQFPPPKDQQGKEEGSRTSSGAYKVEGYKDNENIWQHIYTLKPQ